ncbi:MAG: caspase family protein [Cyanobacteria bacterium P01_F01_bin.53]
MSGLDFDRSLAVVIGIDQYGNGIAPLRTAVSDATAVANALRETHGYEVTTLLDEEAQLSKIIKKIRIIISLQAYLSF